MNDTDPKIAAMVDAHYRALSPLARMAIAAEMYDSARQLIEASLPPGLSQYERRLAYIRRMYGGELPEAVLLDFAERGE